MATYRKESTSCIRYRSYWKTTIIQECLKSTHHSFIELNFKKQPELIELFEKATSTQDLLLRLSVVSKEPLIKGKTVIFLMKFRNLKIS